MGKGRTTAGMVVACLVKDLVFGQSSGKTFPIKQVERKPFRKKLPR